MASTASGGGGVHLCRLYENDKGAELVHLRRSHENDKGAERMPFDIYEETMKVYAHPNLSRCL
jgi:hypothetical protein